MSRHTLQLADGSEIICGYDRPFKTWFAQLYGPEDNPPHGAPSKTVGYHPAEQALTPNGEHGVYPASKEDLRSTLIEWGVPEPMATETVAIIYRRT